MSYRPVRVSDKRAIAFSGQDKVPILVDETGTAISDSWRIAEYLESRYRDQPSLFGGTTGYAFARFINNWVDRTVIPQAAPMLMGDVIECVDAQDAAHLRIQMEKIFGKSLEELRAGRDARIKEFRRALDPARGSLRTQQFLSGSTPAYPDYILFSLFQWARIVSRFDLKTGPELRSKRPARPAPRSSVAAVSEQVWGAWWMAGPLIFSEPHPPEFFEARAKYLTLADKATRTVVLLTERLDQHRNTSRLTRIRRWSPIRL